MSGLDWVVLVGTISFIVGYGVWRSRGVRDLDDYLRSAHSLRWPTIGLGIMATQASAITFISTPGQAYSDGMRFVQFYFGLPLAMILIAAVFVPIFYRLNVYTAYEYLEQRFDVRVRYLGAFLFLVQRGLAAGITIYAPSIILSTIFGWNLQLTNLAMGVLVILYTVLGGARAISETQKQQMVVMLSGMVAAAVVAVGKLPDEVSLGGAVKLAGALGRMNLLSVELDPTSRYNIWSGLTGGFFLALAYFGTDQSQVQRYLSGRSIAESRLGLVFNGLFKIPMQFGILFVGIVVFVFFLFTQPPIFFNASVLAQAERSPRAAELATIQRDYDVAFASQRRAAESYVSRLDTPQASTARAELTAAAAEVDRLRGAAKAVIAEAVPGAELKDADYVFLSFVMRFLPQGLIGLLIAVILCAAMSSISSELSALGSTTTVDFYKRLRRRVGEDPGDLRASKGFTALWGVVALSFASFASLLDNLVQAVNILGSIFYGTVLGIFVVAFFFKRLGATAVLVGAIVAQATVLGLFFMSDIGFLWYNVVGCVVVVLVATVVQTIRRPSEA